MLDFIKSTRKYYCDLKINLTVLNKTDPILTEMSYAEFVFNLLTIINLLFN